MKIMKLKKWAALTLCGVLMLSMLTACQGDSTESESVVQSEVSSSVADPVQAAIQARKDSGEYPKLVIAFPTGPHPRKAECLYRGETGHFGGA